MRKYILGALLALVLGCDLFNAEQYSDDPKMKEIAWAIARNDLDKMRKLKAEGVDINSVGKDDVTFLAFAYKSKKFEAFKEIVSWRGNFYHVNEEGGTYLIDMVRDKDTRYFEYLIDNGLDPNFGGDGDYISFLQQAVVVGKKPELITLLLKKGADPYWSQGSIFFSALSSERYEYCLAFISGVKYIDQSLDWVKGGIKTFQRTQVINEEEKKTREKIREVLAEKGVKVDFEYKDIVKHRDLTVLFD